MAYSKSRQEDSRYIDVKQAADFLQRAFDWATAHMNKNDSGSDLHQYQVDFLWIMRDITDSPMYIVPKHILSANQLIDKIIANETQKGHVYNQDEFKKWRKSARG